MADFDGVIFDCDGTLVDSETISLRVLVEMISERGLELDHAEAMERFAGGDLPKVFAEIETQLDAPLPADFIDLFRARQIPALAEAVEPIHGAYELLSSLTKPFCVASNAPISKVRLCLETAGLLQLIPTGYLHSAYEVNAWKPQPDVFLKAAKGLGLEPEKCAVVEDSKFGVEAGLRAGMHVFAFDPHHRMGDVDSRVVTVRKLSELSARLN